MTISLIVIRTFRPRYCKRPWLLLGQFQSSETQVAKVAVQFIPLNRPKGDIRRPSCSCYISKSSSEQLIGHLF